MTRCAKFAASPPPHHHLAVFAVAGALLAGSAWGQTPVREFPKNALRGEMVVTAPPQGLFLVKVLY